MIKSIQAVTASGAGTLYKVGQVPEGFIVPVGRIDDHGQEWENHIDWIYEIWDANNLPMAELINCPVEIKYSSESEG